MLKYNGKEFRNLEDQVGYLTDAFKSGKLIDELGIKVLGVFPDLTTAKETIRPPYEYGDAFEIGTTKPYNLYIYTRNIEDFFDFGPFPAPGPQGKLGPTPSISINANVTDTTGTPEATVTKTGTDEAPIFNFTFKNIKGERGQTGMQGIQGPRGSQGPTGPIGPKGNTGPKGDVGPAFKLLGDLTSTSQLPTPTAELQAQGAAYTIPNAQGVKHIWVIQGTDNLLWTDIGVSGVRGPQGDPGVGINSLRTVKDIGAPSVTYNTTNGITINNTERYTYITAGSGAEVDVSTEKKIPVRPGSGFDSGIDISANSTNDMILIKNKLGIMPGRREYSLAQKRVNSKGELVAADAYQLCTVALGGNTVAGDPNGDVNAYSFAFAANENNKAISRSSAAFGRGNRTYNPGEFVCGNYSEEGNRSPETVFLVGGGATADKRHNAFEVRTRHGAGPDISSAFIGGKMVATQDYVSYTSVIKQGNSYVLYANEANGKSTVIPYRFQKDSIIFPEYTLMFQPMYNGRLYTRYPTDEYHAATKGYVDSKTRLYRHEITTTDLQRTLVVINNSDAKITKFTDLLNGNYISISIKIDEPGKRVVTPAVAVSTYNSDSSTVVGIQVRYYSNITDMNYGTYQDSKLSSDTVTTL